jgi:fatty-acyl-CoA synthase
MRRTAGALIERHRVTAWSAPPAMVMDLFAHPGTAARDLSSLACCPAVARPCPRRWPPCCSERYGFLQEAYGLTETASFLHANPPGRCKRQCLGMPTQGVDSRIVDPVTLAELPRRRGGRAGHPRPAGHAGLLAQPDADRAASSPSTASATSAPATWR